MAKQNINVGTTANDKKGDSLRAAFQKVNANFTELYVALGLDSGGLNLGAFEFTGSTLSTTDSSSIIIDQATTVTSNLSVGGDIVPQTANGGDLGSSALPWRSLYVSNNTIYIGGTAVGVDANGNLTVNGSRANAPGSTLVNGDYTVSLGSDGLLNAAGPVTLPNYGELRPSSAAYDTALAGWESFRSQEAESAALLGYTVQNRPFIEWRVNGGNVAAYLAELDRVWAIQLTTGATLVWTPAISSALRAQMRAAMLAVQNAYTSVGSDVSIASGQGKYWNFSGDGSLTIPGDIKSNGNINIEINLADSTLRRWQFGEDGALTFPDGTSQSTAGGGGGSTLVNGAYTVSLGSTGTLTLPASGIITAPDNEFFKLQAKDTDSVLRNEINLDPNNGTYMSVWSDQTTSFSFNDWDTGSWNNESGLGAARFTDAQALQNFWTTGIGSLGLAYEVSINGGPRTPNVFYDGNNGEQYGVTLGLDAVPPGGQGTTVPITSLVFYYRTQSKINIDVDGGEILLDAQAMDLDLRTTLNLDLRANQNLNLRGLGAYPVRIYTDDTTHKWEFDNTGSLTLPREGKIYGIGAGANDRLGYISWDGESSGDGSGFNTMRLVPDLQGLEDADQYIIIDPTGGVPGHIHIRAGGTQDNSLAHLFLGGEHSHVKISAGLNPPVTVMANDNSWTFDTDGTTLFPSNSIKNSLGNSTAITTQRTLTANNSYINGVDFSTDVDLGGGNIIAGWYQRNETQIEFALFGDSTFQSYLTGLALGRTVIVTYNTADGTATLTRTLTQAFTGTGQADPNNPTWGRVSGRIDATLPVGQLGIVSINFPVYSTSTNNWTFGSTGSLTFPDSTVQTSAWTGVANIARSIESEGDVSIRVNLTDSTTRIWRFGEDGDLRFPDGTNYSGNDITVPSGGIPTSVSDINSQGGYNIGSYTGLTTSGGTGTGLTVDASTAGNGYISTVTINTAGAGYTDGDVITLVGGDGFGCTFTISASHTWTLGTTGRTIFPNGVVPEHSYGAAGDKEGMVVFTDPYIYYCKQDYVDNSTDIWVRVAWTGTNW